MDHQVDHSGDAEKRAFIARAKARAVEQVEALLGGPSDDIPTTDATGLRDIAGLPPAADSFTGYQIIRELHRGGQGVVYQALQKSTNRKVAIKVMKEGPFADARERVRFEREVQVLGQLRHPNIVAIHDSGETAKTGVGRYYYFVMDYIRGQPLDVWAAARKRPVEEVLKIFAKVCDAVNAAHLRGVIHRDLKPGNIRVDDNDEPHVLDFGLAKVALGGSMSTPQVYDPKGSTLWELDSPKTVQPVTITGQFIGSLPWAAPEQAEGASDRIDLRTDVYALGVNLYQILTGRFPYDVTGPMREVLDRIVQATPTPPGSVAREIDGEVATILLKCLAKDRERRYQSAGELARDIRHYLAGEPIEAKRDSVSYMIRKQLQRHRLAFGVGLSFFVLIAVGLVVALGLWKRAEREAERSTAMASFLERLVRVAGAGQTEIDALLAEAERVLPAGHPLRDSAELHLATTLNSTGQSERSEALCRAMLQRGAANLGSAGVLRVWVLGELSRALMDQKHAGEAEPYLRERLSIVQQMFPERSAAHADALGRLLECLIAQAAGERATVRGSPPPNSQARRAEIEAIWSGLIDVQTALYKREDPVRIRQVASYGTWLQGLGDCGAARPLLEESVQLGREALGAKDETFFNALNSLTICYANKGDNGTAIPLWEELLEICRQRTGARSESYKSNVKNFAAWLETVGETERATKWREKVSAIREEPDTESDAGAFSAARIALELKRFDEVEALVGPLYARLDNSFAPTDDLARAAIRRMLERAASGLGQHQQAERLAREQLARMVQKRGSAHDLAITAQVDLADALAAAGKNDEAEAMLLEARQRAESREGRELAWSRSRALQALYRLYKRTEASGKAAEIEDVQKVISERCVSGPKNLDFEIGDVGAGPDVWGAAMSGQRLADFQVVTNEQTYAGKQCLRMSSLDGAARVPRSTGFRNVMQAFDAKPYRGRRIRFAAAVRVESSGDSGQAYLWLRADRTESEQGNLFDNMRDRPIIASDWAVYEIIGTVDDDAEYLNIGMMVYGDATAWLDDVRFEVLGESSRPSSSQ